jgi:hypothetical protein
MIQHKQKEGNMYKIEMRDHPIYQDEAVQSKLDYCKRKIVPKVNPEFIDELNKATMQVLETVSDLYDAATTSPDSRRLFTVILKQHLKEGISFLEREFRNSDNSGLKLQYVKSYEFCTIKKQSYIEEFGKEFTYQLSSVSKEAIWRVEKDVEKPLRRVTFNEENLEEVKEIPRIGNRSYHSRKSKPESDLESAGNSPANPQARNLAKSKEISVSEENSTPQPER